MEQENMLQLQAESRRGKVENQRKVYQKETSYADTGTSYTDQH